MRKSFIIIGMMFSCICMFAGTSEWQVNRVLQDKENVYVVTQRHGLMVMSKATGEFTNLSGEVPDVSDLSLNHGKLYAVSRQEVLYTIDNGNVSKTYLIQGDGRVSHRVAPCMGWGDDGTLWVSRAICELGCYRKGIYFTSEGLITPIMEEEIRGIAVDSKGRVWMALWSMSNAHCYARYSDNEGLVWLNTDSRCGAGVYAVETGTDGSAWFTSFDGLVHADDAGVLTIVKTPEEYSGVMYGLSVLPDGDIVCSKGKTLLLYHNGAYREICSVPNGETITCIDTTNGTYYLGTSDGLYKYEAGKIEQVSLPGQTLSIENQLSTSGADIQQNSYDLSGRKVSSSPKGVYIQSGKKIIIN